jgi:hypothetical protein
MSRHSVLLASLTATPTSTSELYDRLGYGTLTQIGLVPYDTFRAELDKLAAAGLAKTEAGPTARRCGAGRPRRASRGPRRPARSGLTAGGVRPRTKD